MEEKVSKLIKRLKELEQQLDKADLLTRKKELINISSQSNFWNNSEKAQELMQELGNIKDDLSKLDEIDRLISDLQTYIELSEENQEVAEEIQETYSKAKNKIKQLELVTYFADTYDKYDAILSIHSGQGGTEANDWTEMLMRMYLKFFESKEWKYEVINIIKGNEAGINTVSIEVHGRFAYGYLKGEHGTHRLVRISPFNAQGLRQTSFAGVEVMPLIKSDIEVDLKEEDIEFHAVRSGGAGGQSVNKVNTAARITHIPTGIQVHCSTERSQLRNREAAMQILRGKLFQIKMEEREEKEAKLKGEHKIAGWGNQIRNYVLQPYKLVKDLRTKVETDQVENVLDGDLDKFVNATIRL